MDQSDQLKKIVKEKYTTIAEQDKETNQSSCCGSGCCSSEVSVIMAEDYSTIDGYDPEADLGLGCGLPTRFAKIKKGDVVVDLGSGAGNDAFIARHETGELGKVIGIDFTPAMIEKARKNAEMRGFHNVEFRLGDIENIPMTSGIADVIVSNCVLNLVPNKEIVMKEIFRILKPGGHFSISDVVLEGTLPPSIKAAAEMYAGCVSGAIQRQVYLELIQHTGFKNVTIQKENRIVIPADILKNYLTDEEIISFNRTGSGIWSITVYAEKSTDCCDPGCCK